jgi:pyruvate,water dikinase
MNDSITLKAIQKLIIHNEEAAYFVIVSQLLNAISNRLLLSQLRKRGRKLEDFHLISTEYRDIYPNWAIKKMHLEYKKLPRKSKQILTSLILDEKKLEENMQFSDFRRTFRSFMAKFGHLSDQGNDFSRISWREQPELVLDMVSSHTESMRSQETEDGLGVYPEDSPFLLNWSYQNAKESLVYKERISFNYVKSYSLFRNLFLHLAELFQEKGFIHDLDDIFYFTFLEIKKIVKEGKLSREISEKQKERKKEIAECENVELPEVIYGDEAPALKRRKNMARTLIGIPASGGYYTGKTCIVKGTQDFSKVTEGAVVVIPYSDSSWTPILIKAGAVISESGGLLSHSAVITREFKIPSIVGVKRACDLHDDVKVYVDGFSGTITIQ